MQPRRARRAPLLLVITVLLTFAAPPTDAAPTEHGDADTRVIRPGRRAQVEALAKRRHDARDRSRRLHHGDRARAARGGHGCHASDSAAQGGVSGHATPAQKPARPTGHARRDARAHVARACAVACNLIECDPEKCRITRCETGNRFDDPMCGARCCVSRKTVNGRPGRGRGYRDARARERGECDFRCVCVAAHRDGLAETSCKMTECHPVPCKVGYRDENVTYWGLCCTWGLGRVEAGHLHGRGRGHGLASERGNGDCDRKCHVLALRRKLIATQ